jgi:hypothetical protein
MYITNNIYILDGTHVELSRRGSGDARARDAGAGGGGARRGAGPTPEELGRIADWRASGPLERARETQSPTRLEE